MESVTATQGTPAILATPRLSQPICRTRMEPSNLAPLSAFPFLTPEEFRGACCALLNRTDAIADPTHLGWSSIRLLEETTGAILRISQTVQSTSAHHMDDAPELEIEYPQEPQLCEDDPEALIRTSNPTPKLQVEYDILLSPIYRVPVLYFMLRMDDSPRPLGIDSVYQHLVPVQYRKEVHSVGIMGGISLGYHPESGAPAFFVHPCNTADAMMNIAGRRKITPETYFLIWLGLVGNRLGLHLPCEIFATAGTQEQPGIV